MASIVNSVVPKLGKTGPPKVTGTKAPYEIPERYRNSFYLANAAFYDSVNWFLHRAYEVIFPTLKEKFSKLGSNKQLSTDEVAEKVEGIVNVLDECNSVIDIRFPIKRDDGSYQVIRGFRAHHGLATGHLHCLGGLRIHENITRDHMKALSVLSTYRNACMGINMAGAHGGIKICPKEYSVNELQNIVELYTEELYKKGYLCGHRDVFQPDINTSEREMSWISKTFGRFSGYTINSVSAGKPLECGGIENYYKMASRGAYCALNFFLNSQQIMDKVGLSKGLNGKTFIIQGLGKVGAPLAELLVSNGAICVGVKEHDAYIYEASGIDLKQLYEHRTKTGSIKNFGLCKEEINDTIYTQPCDILIFAAYQKSLICYVANNIQAKVILEAADGPITPTSHKILTGRSKLVIPDIYACSGATITSYLEYLGYMKQVETRCNGILLSLSRNIYENILNRLCENKEKAVACGSSVEIPNVIAPNIVADSVECVLTDTGNEIMRILDTHELGMDVRTAAYIIAIEHIFNALFYQKKFL